MDIVIEENVFKIENGDMILSDSEEQNVKILFEINKGEYKEKPQIGFGANQYLKSNISIYQFKRNLEEEMERDNLKTKIDISKYGILKVLIN